MEPRHDNEVLPKPGDCPRCDATAPGRASFLRSKRFRTSVLLVLLAALVTATHWPSLTARALSFDDSQYLLENSLVQNPSWTSVRRFFTEVLEPSTVGGYYQPLPMISLMLDFARGGHTNNLRPFHETSLMLHVLNTVLVAWLLYLLFGHPWAAVIAGLLFGLHPLTVEPIPWVGERKTLLAAFFSLASLVFYLRAVKQNKRPWFGLSVLLYVLALLSKPTSLPLPLLMLALDGWPLQRLNKQAVIEKAPMFLIGIAAALITFISQDRTAGITLPGEYNPGHVPLVVCYALIFYLSKIIWPVHLSSHYPIPQPFSLANPIVLTSVLGTVVLTVVLLISLRRTRAWFVGFFFFFAALLPTMGVIGFTNVITSDKYAYLPAFGLLLPIASTLAGLGGARKSLLFLKIGLIALLFTITTAEAVTSRRYYARWRDTVGLFRYMTSLAPDSHTLHDSLGLALYEQGDFKEAEAECRESIRLAPAWPEARVNLAMVLIRRGKLDEAIQQGYEAHRLWPKGAKPWVGLGLALAEQGKIDRALVCYEKALQLQPAQAEAHNNIGAILVDQGQIDKAVMHYEAAIRSRPCFTRARLNLAIALTKLGRMEEAERQCREALRWEPDSATAHLCLANLLLNTGEGDNAVAHYRETIRLDASVAAAHGNLGIALAQKGRLVEAVGEFRAAVRLEPMNADMLCNLGQALADLDMIQEAIEAYQAALRINPTHERADKGIAQARRR